MKYSRSLAFLCGLLLCMFSFNASAGVKGYCGSPTAHVAELQAKSTKKQAAYCSGGGATPNNCEPMGDPIYLGVRLDVLCNQAANPNYCPPGSNKSGSTCVCKKGTNWAKDQQACR